MGLVKTWQKINHNLSFQLKWVQSRPWRSNSLLTFSLVFKISLFKLWSLLYFAKIRNLWKLMNILMCWNFYQVLEFYRCLVCTYIVSASVHVWRFINDLTKKVKIFPSFNKNVTSYLLIVRYSWHWRVLMSR